MLHTLTKRESLSNTYNRLTVLRWHYPHRNHGDDKHEATEADKRQLESSKLQIKLSHYFAITR